METAVLNNNESALFEQEVKVRQALSTDKPFIQANTIEGSLEDIKESHVIPVFIKDNEPVISHADFIDITNEVVGSVFHSERV